MHNVPKWSDTLLNAFFRQKTQSNNLRCQHGKYNCPGLCYSNGEAIGNLLIIFKGRNLQSTWLGNNQC